MAYMERLVATTPSAPRRSLSAMDGQTSHTDRNLRSTTARPQASARLPRPPPTAVLPLGDHQTVATNENGTVGARCPIGWERERSARDGGVSLLL